MSEEEPVSTSDDAATIPGFNSIEEFVQNGFRKLVDGTKKANKLPCGKSRDFYEACPTFHKVMREQGEAVLGQLSRLMRHAGCKGNIQRRDNEERLEMIVEANDMIFERVGILLDDIAGIRRNPDAEFVAKASNHISGSWNRRNLATQSSKKISQAVSDMIHAAKNMEKPQLQFSDKVDNSRETPFIPRITFKYNIMKPLALLFEEDDCTGQYSHPYEFELEKWTPSDSLLTRVEPTMYRSLEETPLLYVNTTEHVKEMLSHLKGADAIAIDLEHHSYRTFQGVTCLMQISTREKDFIIDTLALRSDLQCLNEVFTDPKKVKVLHGAQSDIQWLQRDLALYIVNMFDSHIAARVLNYSALSLAYLLLKFCGVHAMKQFQLADWRVRPLPDEMLQYAREDTHYLLYIFDMLRNDLIEKVNGEEKLLRSVFMESNQLCLTRYVKPVWRPDDHLHLYHKSKRLFDNRQLFALQQLYDWRDRTARDFDESTGYVLPNHMLLHIAETLPREVQGILACCNPVPPLVRQHLTPLHMLIRKARDQPLIKPIVDEARRVNRSEGYGLTVDSPLRCPHDLACLPEFRPDLPVLLSNTAAEFRKSDLLTEKSTISVFEAIEMKGKRRNGSKTLTPYQRYKLVKPYADQVAKDVSKEIEDNKQTIQKMETEKLLSIKNDEPVKNEAPTPLRDQFDATELKKRKAIKNKERKGAKKLKKQGLEEGPIMEEKDKSQLVKNPRFEVSAADPQPVPEEVINKNPTEVPPKMSKKKKMKQGDIPLQSFDYSSVDFTKFQSNPGDKLTHKKMKFKNKHKRKGNKKFKISI